MKATDLLEKQHRAVEKLFKRLEGGRGDLSAVVHELANNLAAHMAIEQEIFYPAVKSIDEELVLESLEEHSLAELGMKRLLATPTSHPSFKARVTACKELIEHHVEEEEEDLFPKVNKKLGEEKLTAMAKVMKARFDEVLAAGFDAAVPKGAAGKTSADVTRQSTNGHARSPAPAHAHARR